MSAFGLSAFSAPTSRSTGVTTARRANRAQGNNILASGAQAGDVRGQMGALDRAGMSRGTGQRALAEYQSGLTMADARNSAAQSGYESADFDRQLQLRRYSADALAELADEAQRTQGNMQSSQLALNLMGQAQTRGQALSQYNLAGLSGAWGALTGLLR